MTPDTIFSEDGGNEISIDASQIYAPGDLDFIVHQNT